MPHPVLQVIASTSLQPMDLTTLRAVLWDLRPKLVPSRFETVSYTHLTLPTR